MTTTRSHCSATTPRSCVISTTRHAEGAAQRRDQFQHLGLDGDVQRGGRLVGDQQPRFAGQGDGDHDALAHAAGKLVRVIIQAGLGRRDADQRHHFDRAFTRLAAPLPARQRGHVLVVREDDFEQLLLHREGRVERRERVLHGHGDALAAHQPHRFGRELAQVDAIEQHLARRDLSRRPDQAHHAGEGDALAGARFADHAQAFARQHVQADVLHRLEHARRRGELRRQRTDAEHRPHRNVGSHRDGVHRFSPAAAGRTHRATPGSRR